METFSEYSKSKRYSIRESAAPQYTLFPKDKKELTRMIKDEIKKQGSKAYLNHIDVSKITDFSRLFRNSKFNGDISKWDVSNVTTMSYMFSSCLSFNQDLSGWDVSKVIYDYDVFKNCPCPKEYQPKFKQQ